MWAQEELLKCIWHAFTALDVDHRGKVSKSQLKVLSFNLCVVMKIPFDPVVLEKHFKDEDTGPLSNQGYMPYLSNYILNKVQGDVDILELFKFCWTLCYKKNISIQHLLITLDDAFKVWCIFNFLSEHAYPLIITTEETEYLFRRLNNAMGCIWSEETFAEYHLQRGLTKNGLSAWELIEQVGMRFFKDMSCLTLSTAINEVFQELILGILKQGYMVKKGRNWMAYWFVLRPNSLEYYASEDLMEIKGMIALDSTCTIKSLPDNEGRTCLFLIKCGDTSFEISVSDKTKKKEWMRAIEKCIQSQKLGLLPPHRQARQKRRELRQRQQTAEDELAEKIGQLQAANESKHKELEAVKKKVEEAANASKKKTELDPQDRYKLDLEREKMERLQMEEQMAQKSTELEQYLHRVQELEDMYHQLQEALENERRAKRDEEASRKLQARLLEEEAMKRAELEQIHLQQQRALSQSQAEKQELAEQLAKERKLQEATRQLESLERQRHGAVQHYEVKEVSRKLERAANKTKTCKNKVVRHEGLVRLIQPGHKGPQMITNWGPAAFTEAELELRKKSWQESKNQATAAE